MFFGKIEYLNLLPFHIYLKKALRHCGQKQTLERYKNVPAVINERFEKRRIDAAYISSVKAKRCKKPKLGIVAKKEVKSVLLIPAQEEHFDSESETSNVLAKVLGLKGQVLIGDKALRYALENGEYIDMAREWHARYALPFVFALLCFHKKTPLLKKIESGFLKTAKRVKIPHYLLEKAAKRSGVSTREALDYLSLITYEIDYRSLKSLKLFFKLINKK